MELIFLTNAFFLCVFLTALLSISWFVLRQIDLRVWKTPPGPIGLPLIGYALFISSDLHKDFSRLSKIYGNICSAMILKTRFVVVSDYDTAKELLCHPAALSRPDHFTDFFPGKGGFSGMNGKQWSQERRYAVHALRNVTTITGPWIDSVREEVLKTTDCVSSLKGEPIDICTLLSQSALRNTISLLFGRRCLNEMVNHDLNLIRESNNIAKAEFRNATLFSLFPWLLRYLIMFNIVGYGKKKKVFNEASELCRKLIKERLNSTEKEDSTDFVSQYFEEVKEKNGCKTISDAHVECLLGNIGTFVYTSDTAMLVTQWIFFLMAAYPEIQAKVHQEIDIAIGKNVTVTWEDRKKLPYTLACVLEMERWLVVVPVFPPRCAEKTFEFHGYCIPRGTIILSNGREFNRDPKYWDQPDEYMPERFLKNNAERLSSLEGYAPFSFGKRNCPGEKISVMTTFLYFVGIMQKFEVRTPSGKSPNLSPHYNGSNFEPKDKYLCFIGRK